jgi:hypothetical protein
LGRSSIVSINGKLGRTPPVSLPGTVGISVLEQCRDSAARQNSTQRPGPGGRMRLSMAARHPRGSVCKVSPSVQGQIEQRLCCVPHSFRSIRGGEGPTEHRNQGRAHRLTNSRNHQQPPTQPCTGEHLVRPDAHCTHAFDSRSGHPIDAPCRWLAHCSPLPVQRLSRKERTTRPVVGQRSRASPHWAGSHGLCAWVGHRQPPPSRPG